MIKGYARVSIDRQDPTEHELLKGAGATSVFSEKQSGVKKTDHAALARCLASLEPGNTVLVTKLARSTRDLLNTLATIGDAGASFRSRSVILGQTPLLHMGG